MKAEPACQQKCDATCLAVMSPRSITHYRKVFTYTPFQLRFSRTFDAAREEYCKAAVEVFHKQEQLTHLGPVQQCARMIDGFPSQRHRCHECPLIRGIAKIDVAHQIDQR